MTKIPRPAQNVDISAALKRHTSIKYSSKLNVHVLCVKIAEYIQKTNCLFD